MCLIAFGWRPVPALQLLVVANRDEFHARPASPLGFWADQPDILAGRDIEACGTWLGISRRGRLAAVTNVRLPGAMQTGLRSRGALALDYLAGSETPASRWQGLQAEKDRYGPFNLLLADTHQACYASNQPGTAMLQLQPGLYGLSNATLDSPWPKTLQLKSAVAGWLANGHLADAEPLFEALADASQPADADLPDTGVGLARERFVAPAFIKGREYGTRCSTVVMVDVAGAGLVIEHRFGPEGVALGETRLAFNWPA